MDTSGAWRCARAHGLGRVRSVGIVSSVVLLAFGLAGCDPRLLNPQTSAIEITVQGDPEDGIAAVTAYVEDAETVSRNRQEKEVRVGSAVLFDHLGADYRIAFGITDLGRYRCAVRSGRRGAPDGVLTAAPDDQVSTLDGQTERIFYRVRCRSAGLSLDVAGLPAGDSARVVLLHPADSVAHHLRNGTHILPVVPGTIPILPDSVDGSDGFLYTAQPTSTAALTGQTASATVDYGRDVQSQAALRVNISTPQIDPAVTFRVRIASIGSPSHVDTGTVSLPGSVTFRNLADGARYEVVLSGLDAFRCLIRRSGVYGSWGDSVADTVTVYRIAHIEQSHSFEVGCLTAPLDVAVTGLPPGDSATIDLNGLISSPTLRVPNGTFRQYLVPWLIRSTPQPVAGSDGRTYVAAPDTIWAIAHQPRTLTVPYAAQQPASISGTVTGNGYAVVGATVTLTGAANLAAVTGTNGSYAFGNLPPGTYTLSVSIGLNITFSPSSYTVTLATGEQKVVNFAGTY